MDTELNRNPEPVDGRLARRRVVALLCLEALAIGGMATWLALRLLGH